MLRPRPGSDGPAKNSVTYKASDTLFKDFGQHLIIQFLFFSKKKYDSFSKISLP